MTIDMIYYAYFMLLMATIIAEGDTYETFVTQTARGYRGIAS